MLPDTLIPINTWTNLNTLLSFPTGTLLKVTNKLPYETFLWEGATAPPSTPDMKQGEPVANGESARNTDTTVDLWVLCWSPDSSPTQKGRISVQEWDE